MLEIEEEFKYRLEKALSIRGMKAIDLVNKTGISESAISQYRKGLTKPKHDRLVKIADALSVNPSWLLGLDVPMEVTIEPSIELIELASKYNDTTIEIEIDKTDPVENAKRITKTTETYMDILRCINQLNESGKQDLLKYAKYLASNEESRKEESL